MAKDEVSSSPDFEPNSVDVADESRLAQFGYKQELKRDWGLAHNFGVSFSIIVSSLLFYTNAAHIPACALRTSDTD
jgi:hypothetical protein